MTSISNYRYKILVFFYRISFIKDLVVLYQNKKLIKNRRQNSTKTNYYQGMIKTVLAHVSRKKC